MSTTQKTTEIKISAAIEQLVKKKAPSNFLTKVSKRIFLLERPVSNSQLMVKFAINRLVRQIKKLPRLETTDIEYCFFQDNFEKSAIKLLAKESGWEEHDLWRALELTDDLGLLEELMCTCFEKHFARCYEKEIIKIFDDVLAITQKYPTVSWLEMFDQIEQFYLIDVTECFPDFEVDSDSPDDNSLIAFQEVMDYLDGFVSAQKTTVK